MQPWTQRVRRLATIAACALCGFRMYQALGVRSMCDCFDMSLHMYIFRSCLLHLLPAHLQPYTCMQNPNVMSSCFCLSLPTRLVHLLACLLLAHASSHGTVARRRHVLTLLCDAAHGNEPCVARSIFGLVRRERKLAHLDVRPGRVVAVPTREVVEEVPMRDKRDVRLGPRTQPAPDPARVSLQGVLSRCVFPGFGRPVGYEEEVEPGILSISFERFTGLREGRSEQVDCGGVRGA